METSVMGSNEPSKGLWYPLVVETSFRFKDLLGAMWMEYAWYECQSVQSGSENKCISKGIRKGAAVEKSKSANSELPPTPRRPHPSKPTSSASQTTTASVDEDVLPDEVVPRNNDEDEKMFPEHVDHSSKLELVPFVDTDSTEEEENDEMLIEEEYDDEDMPQIEWNRDNPNLNAGAVYKNMAELRSALTMYYIQSNYGYGTEKNEKQKLAVHCLDPRPRVNRFRGVVEGGNVKKQKYSRCGELGHIGRLCSNVVPVGFGDNDAYQAAVAAATATALKVAKVAAAAVSARISKKGKTKQYWQPRSNKRKRHEFMMSIEGETSVHDQEGEEFVLAGRAGFGDDASFLDREPCQPQEHDFVASATRCNKGATPMPDTSVPEITPVLTKNPGRKQKAKMVVQPMSVPTKNTRSKVVAPSSNTRSKTRA
ncbi:hypothetical protein D1007_07143 [Hordeum vulgare]|nr:hypothetical protein D1007_07143 [Hordeum vulgare]